MEFVPLFSVQGEGVGVGGGVAARAYVQPNDNKQTSLTYFLLSFPPPSLVISSRRQNKILLYYTLTDLSNKAHVVTRSRVLWHKPDRDSPGTTSACGLGGGEGGGGYYEKRCCSSDLNNIICLLQYVLHYATYCFFCCCKSGALCPSTLLIVTGPPKT